MLTELSNIATCQSAIAPGRVAVYYRDLPATCHHAPAPDSVADDYKCIRKWNNTLNRLFASFCSKNFETAHNYG